VVAGRGRDMRLPPGHVRVNGHIEHPTHPDILPPQPGERVIVARRAMPRVGRETRD